MAEYNEAIRRPFQDWVKFGIGALMYMIPVVNFITSFFGTGYMLKCARAATRKNYNLPEWENWGELFIQGLLALVVAFVYMLPAAIIGGIIGGSTLSGMFSGGLNLMSVMQSFTGGMTISGLLVLLALYILPAGFVMLATRDNFKSAFDFPTIFGKAFTASYLIAWVITVVYSIIVMFVATFFAGILALTVVLPVVVMGCAIFMVSVTAATVFGETLGEIKVK